MLIHKDDQSILSFIKPNWKDGPWIAGGAPLAWYKGEMIETDVDVYFNNQSDFDKLHNTFKEEEAKEKSFPSLPSFPILDIPPPKNPDVHIIFTSDNAITIRYKDRWTIQLIRHTFYKSPRDIIDNFDISVCQLVTDGMSNIAFGENTLSDIKNNVLRIETYRVGCVFRLMKYLAYGYKPVPGTLENILALPTLDEDFKEGCEDYDY